MDPSNSYGPVTKASEHGDKNNNFIKLGKCFGQLSVCEILKRALTETVIQFLDRLFW
jgi:hypothetical protein